MRLLRSHWSHFNGELVFTLIWREGGWRLAGWLSKDTEQYTLMNGWKARSFHSSQVAGFSQEQGNISPPHPHPIAFQLHHRRRDGNTIYFSSVTWLTLLDAVAGNKRLRERERFPSSFVIITCVPALCRNHSHAVTFSTGEGVVSAGNEEVWAWKNSDLSQE